MGGSRTPQDPVDTVKSDSLERPTMVGETPTWRDATEAAPSAGSSRWFGLLQWETQEKVRDGGRFRFRFVQDHMGIGIKLENVI